MAQSPCPHRIVDDMGYAFCMGSIGGSVWHGVKGYRNAPRGLRNRTIGSFKAISARAPVLGGNFAIWGLCFSSYDCCFLHWRRKDDPLNAIAAGAATGATLAWRAGFSSMMKSAAIGGVFLAVIEGLGLMMQKAFAGPQQAQQGSMSPFSTYQPAGPGRHVGDLAKTEDAAYEQGLAPAIAGVHGGGDWSMDDDTDAADFGFDDNFGRRNDHEQFDHDVEFNDDDPNSYR